jgi:hypothetical protein
MSDAPERIYYAGGHAWENPSLKRDKTKYIRADLHRAEVEAAVKRAIEACAEKAQKYCHFRTVEGRALKSPAVFTTHTGQDMADLFRALASDPAALGRIINGGGNE